MYRQGQENWNRQVNFSSAIPVRDGFLLTFHKVLQAGSPSYLLRTLALLSIQSDMFNVVWKAASFITLSIEWGMYIRLGVSQKGPGLDGREWLIILYSCTWLWKSYIFCWDSHVFTVPSTWKWAFFLSLIIYLVGLMFGLVLNAMSMGLTFVFRSVGLLSCSSRVKVIKNGFVCLVF